MNGKFNKEEILSKLKKDDSGTIDLSELNIFDAVKTIILISSGNSDNKPGTAVKCKVSTPNIQNFLNDIPLYNGIELV